MGELLAFKTSWDVIVADRDIRDLASPPVEALLPECEMLP
jgi:hypothetical protein